VKVKCPTCEVEGHLQIRGRSARIGHYRGYNEKTRIIEWHKVDKDALSLMVNNGNQSMENGNQNVVIKKEDLALFSKSQWTGRDLNPRPPRCQRGDHSKLIYPPTAFVAMKGIGQDSFKPCESVTLISEKRLPGKCRCPTVSRRVIIEPV
jgi:hypothetical protein